MTHPALALVGLPYQRAGDDPAEGFDCFTLLRYVRARYYNRPTPICEELPPETLPPAEACSLGIYRSLGGALHRAASPWVSQYAPSEGCAVALGRSVVGRLHHCGVVVEGGVLHALSHCGVAWTPLARLHDLYARVEFYECRS